MITGSGCAARWSAKAVVSLIVPSRLVTTVRSATLRCAGSRRSSGSRMPATTMSTLRSGCSRTCVRAARIDCGSVMSILTVEASG